jgi:hypothetical protein
MIQRIQSLYLLIITALMVTMMFLPLATLQQGTMLFNFDVTGLSTVETQSQLLYPTWGLFILTAVISLISLITIFLFRKRILQIRLSVFNALLMIGFYALFIFSIVTVKNHIPGCSMSIKLALSFPVICLILDYLAIRNIGADETLVRSLERLR